MFTHKNIWQGIDKLADEHNLSVSALAKKAGLDSTVFNKSKRFSANKKPHWPSTESLMRIFNITECSFSHFTQLMAPQGPINDYYMAPLIKDHDHSCFDNQGFPKDTDHQTIPLPLHYSGDVFAYKPESEIANLPFFLKNHVFLVAPNQRIYNEDIVLIQKKHAERPEIFWLIRQATYRMEVCSLSKKMTKFTFNNKEIFWMSRIIAMFFYPKEHLSTTNFSNSTTNNE